MKYILALDQGTTSSRAILFDHTGDICSVAQKEFTQHFPNPGWVEHSPAEIWSSQWDVMMQAMSSLGATAQDIASIGITNQRETTIVWEAATGRPVYNAIVWQDRRTAPFCDSLREQPGLADSIRRKTGLIPDAYFSGTKIRWILDNVPGARQKADRGELRFGNVDAWLIWNLTNGRVHATDVTNASRTMLFNIKELRWDQELLDLFGIPLSMMPEVKGSSDFFSEVRLAPLEGVAIGGVAGDQQAALFGQMCVEPGAIKNTYGTGCFVMLNTGGTPVVSRNNLLTTVAWKIGDRVDYALEGSIYVGGSVVQWLRDGLGIIKSSDDIESLAASVPDSGGVYFVPALTGLGAPYWDQYARGTITGITRGTTAAHIARAALDGIAFQTLDIAQAMALDLGRPLTELKVDGGASRNNLLMQHQADLLGIDVVRPRITETTALGAAYLAGLSSGFWSNVDEIRGQWKQERRFVAAPQSEAIKAAKAAWADAVNRTLVSV